MNSSNANICPYCGYSVSNPTDKFCNKCGKSLPARSANQYQTANEFYSVSSRKYSFFEWLGKSFREEFSGGRKFGLFLGFILLFLLGLAYVGIAIYGILGDYMGPEPLMLFLGFCMICSFLVITIPLSNANKTPPHCASCGKSDQTLKVYNYKNMQPRVICDDCNKGKMKFILIGHSFLPNIWLGPFSLILWIMDMTNSFSKKAIDQEKTAEILKKFR